MGQIYHNQPINCFSVIFMLPVQFMGLASDLQAYLKVLRVELDIKLKYIGTATVVGLLTKMNFHFR